MSKQKKNDQQKVRNLQDAIERKMSQETNFLIKTYILDDENAIAISYLPTKGYTMTHYKMIYGKLYDLVRENINASHGKQLKKQKLFMLMKNDTITDNYCAAIYDYEHGKFIAKKGTFDNIGYDLSVEIISDYTPWTNYLKQHNCFLAYFSLMSNGKRCDDRMQYKSSINGSYYWYDFEPPKETYYAFVNVDGTIRGNCLFKGDNLTKIEQVIDLRQYGSLEEFKTQRRNELTEIGKQNKKAYYDRVGMSHYIKPSPYLDEEVIKVMQLLK